MKSFPRCQARAPATVGVSGRKLEAWATMPAGLLTTSRWPSSHTTGQRPVPGNHFHFGGTVISRLHGQHVPRLQDSGGAGAEAVDQDAGLRVGQAGDGMGGKMQLRAEDMTDSGPRLLRRDRIANSLQAFSSFALQDNTETFPWKALPASFRALLQKKPAAPRPVYLRLLLG